MIDIKDLSVKVESTAILKGINLNIGPGEVHVVMGRNGSGKTTLAHTILGNPNYQITAGSINFEGKDISNLKTHERAKLGIFLGFQNPVAIPGVPVGNFLRTAMRNIYGDKYSAKELRAQIKDEAKKLNIDDNTLRRYLNDGFSGGEKKRLETLQLRLLKPKLSILDETDSGLDVDALKRVADSINELRNSSRSFLIITHYRKMLDLIKPDKVHVLIDGKIIKVGNLSLADLVEKEGYDSLIVDSV